MINKYKVVISNRNIYKEVELPMDAKTYRIGTSIECDYRLHKELFFEEIRLDFTNDNGEWHILCSDNVYISFGDSRRLLTTALNHGDSVLIKYQESNNDAFTIEFTVDFDNKVRKFERRIELEGIERFSIGSGKENNIVIHSEYASNDNIRLSKNSEGLKVSIISSSYGVYKNGTKIKDGEIIRNRDFLSLADITFYYKDGTLWTEASDECRVNGNSFVDYPKKNHYPRFIRNSRIRYRLSDEKIGLLVAPQKPKKPQQNLALTLIPALAMLALVVVVRGIMSKSSNNSFIIFSAFSMAMGIITSIATFFTTKSKYKKECKDRVEQYNNYIKQKKQEIEEARTHEKIVLDKIYYDTNTDIDIIEKFSTHLFDRVPSDWDFLKVFIGRGLSRACREIDYKKQEEFETDDELANIPTELTKNYKWIEECPISVDIRKNCAIGVLGSEEKNHEFFKILMVDIITRQYFGDVKVYLLLDQVKKFLWAKKMPHIYANNGLRNIVFDSESRNNVFESLYKELNMRKGMKNCESLPYIVVFVKQEWGIKTHPVSQFIEEADKLNTSFIFFGTNREDVPLYCGNIIKLKENYEGVLLNTKDGENERNFVYQGISDENMFKISSILEPVYCDEISLESSLRKSISIFELLNIYSVDDINLLHNWDEAKVWNTMEAPIGVNSKNEIVSLNLHEKYHGPHGLVAGTTGSGKSEILQTYILSAAILYHPYEVSFVIIDFKGGGMVNQFKELPHLIGAITNIDGREIDRSLKSIKAELLKRQELFAKANVNHIDKYIQLYKNKSVDIPLPHLIIIVDEFAELKAEQPEFMKELISAARIGRSLGVHLILATQKPSGQVNEQIWSNSKFKLCLKVQNKEDSNEVLKSPLAAEIKEPGRAYLQVGNNEIFELLQSGFSGASEKENDVNDKSFVISQVDFSGRRKKVFEQKKLGNKENSRTQLEAIVQYVNDICYKERIDKLPNICLPPLPQKWLIEEQKENQSGIVIGIYDDPDSQYQGEAWIDLANENYLIIGASFTGKTNLLQVIIRQIVSSYTLKQANIYIMDFGAMYLKNYENLCYVGGVVTISEEEKVKNLFKLIIGEIKSRKKVFLNMGISSYASYEEGGFDDIPRIFVLLDNYAAFKEIYGEMYEEEFVYMIREGLTCGINVILTNSQTSGIGYKYMSNFAGKIALCCNDSSEYSTLFERCRMKPKEVAGRALCKINKEIFETQIYLAFEGEKEIERSNAVKKYVDLINKKYKGTNARKIPEIPEELTIEYIENNYKVERNQYSYPIALDYSNVDMVMLDFGNLNELAIIGNDSAKRLYALESVIQVIETYILENNINMYVIDNVRRSLKEYKEKIYVDEYTLDYSRLEEIIISLEQKMEDRYNRLLQNEEGLNIKFPLQLVIINSKEAIEYISSNKQILEKYNKLVKQYKTLGICFIYSDIEDAAIPYAAPELMKHLKENKKAIITTQKLKDFKFCEVPSSIIRTMKPLETRDVYLLGGTEVSRIKITEVK